jgi:hypothetical protein
VASGITTSGTSVDFANFALRAKQTLQDSASSVNLPVSFFCFAGVLGMIVIEQMNCNDEIILVFMWHEYFTERRVISTAQILMCHMQENMYKVVSVIKFPCVKDV